MKITYRESMGELGELRHPAAVSISILESGGLSLGGRCGSFLLSRRARLRRTTVGDSHDYRICRYQFEPQLHPLFLSALTGKMHYAVFCRSTPQTTALGTPKKLEDCIPQIQK
jgi:hypothetical protein